MNRHDNKDKQVMSVSELNARARRLLELSLSTVWVEGEISNFARPSSGHCYFTLKDSGAQIRCAMFRSRSRLLKFQPREGLQVSVRGKVSLYEGRGDYQLIVENMSEAGDGALRRAFDELKLKLEHEGLFAESRKQALPTLPRRVGVITSPTGAAIHDILTVMHKRFPATEVVIIPTAVQGAEAAAQIVLALTQAQGLKLDLLIVGRGGGSLEDLWPFNEESVARAIAACPIPTISAVGHEVDFSISDMVADQRAPTPSAAAALATPDGQAFTQRLDLLEQRLVRRLQEDLSKKQQQLTWLSKRLRHPGQRLQEQSQRVDGLELRLKRAIAAKLQQSTELLQHGQRRLQQQHPEVKIFQLKTDTSKLYQRLFLAMRHQLDSRGQKLANQGGRLHALSPLATLQRGYSISLNQQGEVIQRSEQVTVGERITNRLAEGELVCEVLETKA